MEEEMDVTKTLEADPETVAEADDMAHDPSAVEIADAGPEDEADDSEDDETDADDAPEA